jgi:hypothetical protein
MVFADLSCLLLIMFFGEMVTCREQAVDSQQYENHEEREVGDGRFGGGRCEVGDGRWEIGGGR